MGSLTVWKVHMVLCLVTLRKYTRYFLKTCRSNFFITKSKILKKVWRDLPNSSILFDILYSNEIRWLNQESNRKILLLLRNKKPILHWKMAHTGIVCERKKLGCTLYFIRFYTWILLETLLKGSLLKIQNKTDSYTHTHLIFT